MPLARAVKTAAGIPAVAVGLIAGFDQAEAIVATREADMVGLARTILYDPRWPWHAAAELGAQVQAPFQYLRSQPRRFRDLLVARAFPDKIDHILSFNTFGRSLEDLGIFWWLVARRLPSRLRFAVYELLHHTGR